MNAAILFSASLCCALAATLLLERARRQEAENETRRARDEANELREALRCVETRWAVFPMGKRIVERRAN